MGSASELEYHFLLTRELGLLNEKDSASLNNQIGEVKRMITVLIQKLRADQRSAKLKADSSWLSLRAKMPMGNIQHRC